MSRRASATPRSPRVGLFGLLGSGNIGNDGSLRAVLDYLATEHPAASLDVLCPGPERVSARHGVAATPLHWARPGTLPESRLGSVTAKLVGKFVDAVRTLRWVRRFDVVIVPGMGVLESTLPLRPWGFPYALFLLCLAGRIGRTRVALLNIGATVPANRLTGWLFAVSARLVHHRSFRDETSRNAVRRLGVDVTHDGVYPDLVFGLPDPGGNRSIPGTVGVGVMDFHGNDEDRARAADIHDSYLDGMRSFVAWLVDSGRHVRLFSGDEADEAIARKIADTVDTTHDEVSAGSVTVHRPRSLETLMTEVSVVDTVVASRYHNVLCALKLAKPTMSVSYAAKNDEAMARWGLAEYCHPARKVDVPRLIDQFVELENDSARLRRTLAETTAAQAALLARQWRPLSASLFGPRSGADHENAHDGGRR